jgi:serine/threonine protein kinase
MRVIAGVRDRTADETLRILRPPAVAREVIDERYEITSLIGRGGMAEVFAARDRRLERAVAIKRPRRDVDGDAAISDRLQREGIALAGIDSPHVVAIHDVGATPEGVYLVMQRLHGRTLDAELERSGPLAPTRACRIARDILAGLAAVHATGLVHRDLKASNVLLDERSEATGGTASRGIDRRERAVLLDLGAALHPRKRPLTAPGTVLGTRACLAPEQLSSGPIDGRVDLFQLGLMLVFLLTGRMARRAVDPRKLAIPATLREVIARSLAPVDGRYTSAVEMRRALDQALAACTLEPIEPLIPSRPTLRWPEPIPRT